MSTATVTALPCRTPRTYQVRVLTAGRCTFHGPVLLEPMPGGLMAVCSGRHSGVHLTEEEALRALFPDATYITTGSTLAHLMHTFADALRQYSDGPVANVDLALLQSSVRFIAEEVDQTPENYGEPARLEE